MSDQKKPGLIMEETLWGYFAEGETDFEKGERKGETSNNRLQFWVAIDIESMDDFVKISGHKATMTGRVSCPSFGKNLTIKNGKFNLYQPDSTTGKRRITYQFSFTGQDNRKYYLDGYKVIYHDRGIFDPLEDMTILFTRVYRGSSKEGELLGAGIVRYHISDFPAMIASMKATHCKGLLEELRVKTQYFSFIYGEMRDTYLDRLSPFYHTAYENLVLNGHLLKDGESKQFFLISGIHDKDFPWGDQATFWDIGLLIQENANHWRRYALSKKLIENLNLDVQKGIFSYEGEIFEITKGFKVSFRQMEKETQPDHLEKLEVRIRLNFKAEAFPKQTLPFILTSDYMKHVTEDSADKIRKWLPHFDKLGMNLKPHKVIIEDGEITLKNGSAESVFTVDATSTLGEAEISNFKSIRKPSLYYNYFCAIDPARDSLAVHVRTDTLKEDRQDIATVKIEEQLGKLIDRLAWLDIEIKGNDCSRLSRVEGDAFPAPDEILLQIDNNHYPTAVFQRRIVKLNSGEDEERLALEENMDVLNLAAINCDRSAIVVAVKDSNKVRSLHRVVEKTGFFDTLNSAWNSSGKDKKDFSIIIKPNFMFMYSLKDRTTFTDPDLIEHLISQIYNQGYTNIAVAEGRSTYGAFFTNREVETVASYIGLDGVCPGGETYRIVDLSQGLEAYEYDGKLGRHHVNTEWKNADFRISFAKNKTHSYAFYTLTLKNIYGALPMQNKFKEYHCERDIFSTTIEYLKHFPVHFGFIDAHISADGPFGIFADKSPNYTDTIIGGDDLVAVDWIGAAKMGLAPEDSGYMKLAVEAFGKPEIHMLGDRTVYPNWVNVPETISKMAFMLDRHYNFGHFFYSIFATMDPFFEYKGNSTIRRIIRLLNTPIRYIFFERMR